MTGDAAGMMIRDMTDSREARKDMPISFKDSGVFFTAPLVFKTITGIAMMQTTITFDVRPMPYVSVLSYISPFIDYSSIMFLINHSIPAGREIVLSFSAERYAAKIILRDCSP